MKRILLSITTVCCFILLYATTASAQVTLVASPYQQNFNALTADGLPAGWSIRSGATASALGTSPAFSAGVLNWSNTGGNFKNVASATGLTTTSTATDQNNSTNRALAVRQTGSFGDPGAAFVLQLSNTTGITNLSLSFKIMSLDPGALGRTTTWRVDYGTGASPSTFTAVTTTPAVVSTTLSAATWGSTDVTVNFGTALDNISDVIWIRLVAINGTTGSNSRPLTGIDDVNLTFTAGDLSAPAFTANYPKAINPTASGFDLVTNLNEAGKTYFVVVADGASEPTPGNVKAGEDGTGVAVAAGFSGMINVAAGSTDYTTTVSSLADGTDYDVYVIAEDVTPNIQAVAVRLDVRTNTAGDLTPPDFSANYPVINTITPFGFTIRTSQTEQGKTYFAVVGSADAAPSSAQIKAGLNAAGGTLSTGFFGMISVPATGTEYSTVLTSLLPGTAYSVYIVAEDNVPNIQANPTKIDATTGALFTENFNTCDGTASFTQYSSTGDQTWACSDFGRGSKGMRMNGFSGVAVANEDWLISPKATLGTNAALSFYSQFSFVGNGLQLKISTNYSGQGIPQSATWTDINGSFPTVAVGSTSTALADWTLSNVDLSAYAGQNVYIAFVYTSTAAAAARWSLDEINITNTTSTYLQASPSGITFSASGMVKSYTTKGYNLASGINIVAPANFQVSKDNTAFSSSISFTALEANAQQVVYVKFIAPGVTPETFSGLITNASAGVATRNIILSATDRTQTLDIATYNLEFFGTDVRDASNVEFGPIDDALQITNVRTVMQTIGADIYAIEEMSDDNALNQLMTDLPRYKKIISPKWSYSFDPPEATFPPQKIGFIYDTLNVKLIRSRVMFSKMHDDIRLNGLTLPGYPTTSSSFWSSGRLPFMATFEVKFNGVKKIIHVIDIHAKSGSAADDYDRRAYDVKVLRDSLNAHYANDNVILLGDFNDDVDNSIKVSSESTYKVFVDDVNNFSTLTYALSQAGGFSFPSSSSFLDHIIISNELTASYVANSIAVEEPRNYISSYTTTTSDHLPVTARFFLVKAPQTITFAALADKKVGDPVFGLTATSTSNLPVGFALTTATDKITIAAGQVTIVKAGRVSITASQTGDEVFAAATAVPNSFCIKPAQPTVTLSNTGLNPVLTSNAAAGNQWYLNGTLIAGATNATLTVTQAGTYKVQVKADDCLSAFSTDLAVVVTGDLFTTSGSLIRTYPNPVRDILFINGFDEDASIATSLTDLLGKTHVLNVEKESGNLQADVRHLSEGMYVLTIREGRNLHQIKFIKKY
ncbi:MAG: T9SS type A sorting domain-containing protein [Cyclobacteriaceae bacterium]|nr:T9SS type A sorting domain-containing protein [Cyclobacteriaceae bacterium]